MNADAIEVGKIEVPDSETEQRPEPSHWPHPTDSTVCWCGKPKKRAGFASGVRAAKSDQEHRSCPMCSDLMRRFGSDWWWDTHCLYYESRCHVHAGYAFHDCVALRA